MIEHGFPIQGWRTFRQALSLGRNVCKGEQGTTVVGADRFIPEEENKTGARDRRGSASDPVPKRFTDFNLAQPGAMRRPAGASRGHYAAAGAREPKVEVLMKASGDDFRIGGGRAVYIPAHDYVQAP